MTPSAPVVGYRFWRVDPADIWTGGQLESPFSETLWPPRDRLEAVCKSGLMLRTSRPKAHKLDAPKGSPVEGCSCGIYAYHEIKSMLREVNEQRLLLGGAVLCWGRIVIHPEGIRAQFARPLALCLPDQRHMHSWGRGHLEEVAHSYGVPLLEPEYLVAYASEFGACYKPDLTRPSPTAPVRGALDGRHFGQLLRDLFRKLLGG